eukprot:11180276-Lingulodinium_polyedra.AAC.1
MLWPLIDHRKGHRSAVVWPPICHGVASGWPLMGRAMAIGVPWRGHCLAIVGHRRAIVRLRV